MKRPCIKTKLCLPSSPPTFDWSNELHSGQGLPYVINEPKSTLLWHEIISNALMSGWMKKIRSDCLMLCSSLLLIQQTSSCNSGSVYKSSEEWEDVGDHPLCTKNTQLLICNSLSSAPKISIIDNCWREKYETSFEQWMTRKDYACSRAWGCFDEGITCTHIIGVVGIH